MPLKTSTSFSSPCWKNQFATNRWSLPRNHVGVKSPGMPLGLANALPPKPHPRDWQGEQMPHSCPEGGGGEPGIHWCIIATWHTEHRITGKRKGKIKFETKKRRKNNYAIRGRADTVKHKEAKCAICAVGFEATQAGASIISRFEFFIANCRQSKKTLHSIDCWPQNSHFWLL